MVWRGGTKSWKSAFHAWQNVHVWTTSWIGSLFLSPCDIVDNITVQSLLHDKDILSQSIHSQNNEVRWRYSKRRLLHNAIRVFGRLIAELDLTKYSAVVHVDLLCYSRSLALILCTYVESDQCDESIVDENGHTLSIDTQNHEQWSSRGICRVLHDDMLDFGGKQTSNKRALSDHLRFSTFELARFLCIFTLIASH